MNLTVIEKFAEHEVGDAITDAEKVADILKSEFARFVVKVAPAKPAAAPSEPAPEPAPAAAASEPAPASEPEPAPAPGAAA